MASLFRRDSKQRAPLVMPPSAASPTVAWGLVHGAKADRGVLLATLIDLIDRGFYDATVDEGVDMDITLAVPALRRRAAAAFEQPVIDFFDLLLADGPKELARLHLLVPQNSAPWRERWNTMLGSLRAERGRALRAAGDPLGEGVGPAPTAEQRDWRWFETSLKQFPKRSGAEDVSVEQWRRILILAFAFDAALPILRSARDAWPSGKQSNDLRIPWHAVEQVQAPGAPWHPLLLTDFDGHVANGCFQFYGLFDVRINPPEPWVDAGAYMGGS